ncbi:MAG: hypothetical protein FD169_522 [Bacillota bacterium]|nr:MAG: hypothetical protein FD169_522 [Bacillota bacterium]
MSNLNERISFMLASEKAVVRNVVMHAIKSAQTEDLSSESLAQKLGRDLSKLIKEASNETSVN